MDRHSFNQPQTEGAVGPPVPVVNGIWPPPPRLFDQWAERKLHLYDAMKEDFLVEIGDLDQPTPAERAALVRRIRKLNFVVYHCRKAPSSKNAVKRFGTGLGLNRLDSNPCADEESISSVRVAANGVRQRYIPYTNRPLGWHTDGYYNSAERKICSFILHCIRPARDGGTNFLLDPEIVYLLVRERGPEHVAALSDPQAFSIPPDKGDGAEPRPSRIGPVFSMDPDTGALHMRYTARTHHITWSPSPHVRKAAEVLRETIDRAGRYTVCHKLESGQGIVCNNVLHKRSGFTETALAGQGRLMYRARYYDRVVAT